MENITIEEMAKIGINISDPTQAVGTMSGGQRQTLAIARAIYRNPEVIFMDESTSALDVKTEGIILDKIRNHFKGKTILMIAHRKSSLDKCDRVLTLEEGKII